MKSISFSIAAMALGICLIGTSAFAATNLYRVAETGLWDDGNWKDLGGAMNTAPTAQDDAYIGGYQQSPPVPGWEYQASVTIDGIPAVASNVWISGQNNRTDYLTKGKLVLTNGASLTVGEDLVIGYSRDGRNEAVLRMDDGTTLNVGRDLIAGVGTYDFHGNPVAPTVLPGDAVTIGRNLVIAVDYDTMFQYDKTPAVLKFSGGTIDVPGYVHLGFGAEGRGELYLTNSATLVVGDYFRLGGIRLSEGGGVLQMDAGSKLVVDGDLQVLSSQYGVGHPDATWGTNMVVDAMIVVSNTANLCGQNCNRTSLTRYRGTTITCKDFNASSYSRYTTHEGKMWLEDSSLLVRRPESGTALCLLGYNQNSGNYTYVYLGNAEVPGTIGIEETGGSGVVDLRVGGWNPRQTHNAELRGWGRVELDGNLVMHGAVYADGWGVERELVMTNFAAVLQQDGNGSGTDWLLHDYGPTNVHMAGWYAVNGGKLLLPPLNGLNPGDTVRWGDTWNDTVLTSNDLANSAMLACDADVTGGDVSIALLAADREDSGVTLPETVIGVWDVDGSGFDFGGGNVTLSFRFDNWLAADKGLAEEDLRLWQLTEEDLKLWQYHEFRNWKDVTASLDTAENVIVSQPLSSFSLFAVSTEIPAPPPPPLGTIILIR